jgi:catechol 2,3-dioxygenase-like lactoylglutathione lyase family enzyme
MPTAIKGIDHPVVAVRDMEEARERYARLGFTIPPRGSHIQWGTGNWCMMFPDDYLELRGIVDPARYTHNLDKFLTLREGLMGIAFAPKSADETYRLASAAGLNPTPPRELTRNFEHPEGFTKPSFRLVFLDPDTTPELMASLACEHLTPELIRRPDWLRHPNGVTGIASMTSVVDEPASVIENQGKLFGADNIAREDGGVTVRVSQAATVRFLSSAAAARQGEAISGVKPPYLSSITLRCESADRVAALLKANGVPFEAVPDGSIRVGPAEACGTILRFIGR